MNNTATVRRVLRFLCVSLILLLVAACSRTSQSTYAPNEVISNDIADARFGSDPFDPQFSDQFSESFSEPNVLASLDSDGMGIEFSQSPEAEKMIIRTSAEDVDYKVSRLDSPSRLVLDVYNGEQRLNRIFDVQESSFIDQLRVGAHSDKSRIVLDLNEVEGFSYDAEGMGGALIVSMTSDERLAMADKAMAKTELAPDTQQALSSQPLPSQAIFADTVDEEALPEEPDADGSIMAQPNLEDDSLGQVNRGAQIAGPQLEDLRIQPEQNQENTLVAEMNSAGFFTLQKTAPSEYVLRLEGATFNPDEIGTLLAPPKSGAIRSVRPTRSGSDTLLRIFTDPSKKLVARTQGSNIIVEEEYFAPATEIRAQADVEVADEELGEDTDLSALESEVSSLLDESPKYTGRQISLDLQDTDIDNALRIIAEVSNLNIIASDDVTGKVTLRLIDVPWDQALDVILKTNGLDSVLEGNVMRIAPIEKLRQEREALKEAREAEEELEPLVVKYVRISYAKASELRPLVETVLTERGTVTYDERTNQLIIKDIARGVKNVAELVSRLDLRTPQVLLETQIVEAQRSFLREFGSEIGFSYIASPETGNPTGDNFPNSINIGGSVDSAGAPGLGSSFPAAVDATGGSAISLLLDSADGTRGLDLRLSALEREGRVRIVSRPAVATTNNQQAIIKSVEKIRVKTPSGGLSVATGSGASASGSGGVATETIEIGIILEVTPQASPDYFVLLDINAKSSTLGSTIVDGIPSEVERSATSTVLVSSGQTFAMGGIYKITDRDSVDGVPFLKDIPFLGHLFRTQQVDNADEELIFFITPRIVEGSFDDAAMKLST